MKIKLVKNVPYIFGYIGKGAEVDLPIKDAQKLIDAGYAESVSKVVEVKVQGEIKVKKAKPSKKGEEV